MAQARKRLHRRLSWQGATVPAALLRPTLAGLSPAPVPSVLIDSTLHIASGSSSNIVVTTLAREVLRAMMLNQIKFAAVLAAIGSVCVTSGLAWAVAHHPAKEAGDGCPTKATRAGSCQDENRSTGR